MWILLAALLLVLRDQARRAGRRPPRACPPPWPPAGAAVWGPGPLSADERALLAALGPSAFGAQAGAADPDPQVDATKTPVTDAQVLGAIAAAWQRVTGQPAPRAGQVVLAAQADLETGTWKYLYGFNLGNITHVAGDGFAWNVRPEVTAPLQFRVYPTLLAGAEDLVRWAQKHGILQAAGQGDLDGYAAGLKRGCYLGCVGPGGASDADYASYQAGIAARAKRLGGVTPEWPSPLDTIDPGVLWAAAAAAAGGLGWWQRDAIGRAAGRAGAWAGRAGSWMWPSKPASHG